MSEGKRVNYGKFIVESSAARAPSSIRELMRFVSMPGMLNLAGGMPNPGGFPVSGVKLTLKNGEEIDWSPQQTNQAFQYGVTWGLPPLVKFLKSMMTLLHGKQESKAWELLVTTGSQDGLSKSIDMLIDQGDSIILGAPGYPGLLCNLMTKNANLVSVPMDANGIDCDAVEAVLANWETGPNAGKPFPKCVYVVPVGCNPSGATMSYERKVQLVAIASKYDILILEDDPYFFLTHVIDTEEHLQAPATDVKAWNCPKSMWEIDTEGRVLRFESFSKVMSAGIRVGYVMGPTPLIVRLMLHSQASVLHCSSMTQMTVFTFLNHVGLSGLLSHVRSVRAL